jgi:hypothetical protein
MNGQETQLTKTRGRRGPAPTGVGTLVGVRLHPPQLAALDAWITRQPSDLSRPEAVRQLLATALDAPAGG